MTDEARVKALAEAYQRASEPWPEWEICVRHAKRIAAVIDAQKALEAQQAYCPAGCNGSDRPCAYPKDCKRCPPSMSSQADPPWLIDVAALYDIVKVPWLDEAAEALFTAMTANVAWPSDAKGFAFCSEDAKETWRHYALAVLSVAARYLHPDGADLPWLDEFAAAYRRSYGSQYALTVSWEELSEAEREGFRKLSRPLLALAARHPRPVTDAMVHAAARRLGERVGWNISTETLHLALEAAEQARTEDV